MSLSSRLKSVDVVARWQSRSAFIKACKAIDFIHAIMPGELFAVMKGRMLSSSHAGKSRISQSERKASKMAGSIPSGWSSVRESVGVIVPTRTVRETRRLPCLLR